MPTERLDPISPCPYCKNKNMEIHFDGEVQNVRDGGVTSCQTWCPRCGACGPYCHSVIDAIDAHNQHCKLLVDAAKLRSSIAKAVADLHPIAREYFTRIGWL